MQAVSLSLDQALIHVKLSQISYCGMEAYMSYSFTGILTGSFWLTQFTVGFGTILRAS